MYSYIKEDEKGGKTAKGIKMNVILYRADKCII